jgi:hypothetical protein
LLAGAIKIIDDWQDLTQGAAGDLQTQILLISGLTFAVVVKIGGDAHVLSPQRLMLATQGRQLGLHLLEPLVRSR